jgi:dynein heavy chain
MCAKQSILANPRILLDNMKGYDKENIPESTVKRVNAILAGEDFTLEKAKGASGCLVGVLKWSSAMMTYHELLKIVNPKRAKVKEMNEKLAIVRAELAAK